MSSRRARSTGRISLAARPRLNGVSFTSFQSNGLGDSTGAGMVNYPGGAYAPNGNAFPNYGNLTPAYQQIAAYGVYSNDGNGSLTLNGLNVGLDTPSRSG